MNPFMHAIYSQKGHKLKHSLPRRTALFGSATIIADERNKTRRVEIMIVFTKVLASM